MTDTTKERLNELRRLIASAEDRLMENTQKRNEIQGELADLRAELKALLGEDVEVPGGGIKAGRDLKIDGGIVAGGDFITGHARKISTGGSDYVEGETRGRYIRGGKIVRG